MHRFDIERTSRIKIKDKHKDFQTDTDDSVFISIWVDHQNIKIVNEPFCYIRHLSINVCSIKIDSNMIIYSLLRIHTRWIQNKEEHKSILYE